MSEHRFDISVEHNDGQRTIDVAIQFVKVEADWSITLPEGVDSEASILALSLANQAIEQINITIAAAVDEALADFGAAIKDASQ